MVRDNKIAFVGVSKGAEVAMVTALYCPQVRFYYKLYHTRIVYKEFQVLEI